MNAALLMFDIGAGELLLVALLAIMLYGGDLPDVARKTGQQIRKIRGVADDLKRQVQAPPEAAEVRQVLREADPRAELRALDPTPEIRRLDAPKSTDAPAAEKSGGAAPASPPPPPATPAGGLGQPPPDPPAAA
jgi:Sec-independent protein translocase protein TatA